MPSQRGAYRHDVLARVFRLKFKNLVNLIFKSQVFGDVLAYTYSVKRQKRGHPNAHVLFWLSAKIKAMDIDIIISAEVPNQDVDKKLYNIAAAHRLHIPCDTNSTSIYLKNWKCSITFPRQFLPNTHTAGNGYP